MEAAMATLQAISQQDFLWSVGLIMYVTCMGVLPNNNDFMLVSAMLVAKMKLVPLPAILATVLVAWVLGESTMFMLGSFLGKRLMQWKFVQKRIKPSTSLRLEEMINQEPLPLFIALRFSPVLRAFMTMAVGSLGMHPKTFFTRHPLILASYILLVGTMFYYLGPLLQEVFGRYQLWFAGGFILCWMAGMVWIGRRFYRRMLQGA